MIAIIDYDAGNIKSVEKAHAVLFAIIYLLLSLFCHVLHPVKMRLVHLGRVQKWVNIHALQKRLGIIYKLHTLYSIKKLIDSDILYGVMIILKPGIIDHSG